VLNIVKRLNRLEDEGFYRTILRIPGTQQCIKFGQAVQLSEAAALLLVAETTTVPVPKVYTAFRHKDITYILMDFIEGETIGKDWAERSEEEKESLLKQLKGFVEQLRNIPNPRPGVMAAADMQSLFEPRSWKGCLGIGPHAKEADFNDFLRSGMQIDDTMLKEDHCKWVTNEEKQEMRDLITMYQSKQHAICFTHGDLSSSKIMVKDGKVVALIDFEVSGSIQSIGSTRRRCKSTDTMDFGKLSCRDSFRSNVHPYVTENPTCRGK
jgi:aminoglycoside phosphotransferase (APT) family kinase protein